MSSRLIDKRELIQSRTRKWLRAIHPRRLQRRFWVGSRSVRFFIKSFLNVGIVLSQTGCPRYLKDRDAHQKPFQLDLKGVQCMSQIPEVFNEYFGEEFKESRLHETTECIDDSLDQFLISVRGENEEIYRAEEVQRFFQRYIFKRPIPDEMIREIMKFKVALLGGSTDFITRSEIVKLHSLLDVFEEELLRVHPHLDIYSEEDRIELLSSSYLSRVELAMDDLRTAVHNILPVINLWNSDYTLHDLNSLIEEVSSFYGRRDGKNQFGKWKSFLPLMHQFKVMVLGESMEVRTQREITEIWDFYLEAFRLKLQYYGGLERMEWTKPSDFEVLDQWVDGQEEKDTERGRGADGLFALISKGLSLRNKSQIPFERIDDMIEAVEKGGFLEHSLSARAIKITYRQFIDRFLENQSSELVALDSRHILRLHREYKGFKLIQKVLLDLFKEENYLPKTDVIERLNQVSLDEFIQKVAPYSVRDQKFIRDSWKEYLSLIHQTVSRHWDPRGRVSVQVDPNDTWSYAELTEMNLFRAISSFFMRAYAEPRPGEKIAATFSAKVGEKASEKVSEKVTEKVAEDFYVLKAEHLKTFYDEFHDFGKEMRLFDLRDPKGYLKTAREADLFTPSGNGDGKIQFSEFFDLLSLIWSGGVVGVNDFKTLAALDHCEIPEKDYFDKPYLKKECSEVSFKTNFLNLFSHLPQFVKHVEGLGDKKWDDFYSQMMRITQVCPSNSMGLETGDQRAMMVVVHYLENIFSVYDYNQDKKLDDEEVTLAYPRFQNFIMDIARQRIKESNPYLNRVIDQVGWKHLSLNIFKFIVFQGKIPTSEDIGLWDLLEEKKWTTKVDRGGLMRVFAALKELNPPSQSQCYEKAN